MSHGFLTLSYFTKTCERALQSSRIPQGAILQIMFLDYFKFLFGNLQFSSIPFAKRYSGRVGDRGGVKLWEAVPPGARAFTCAVSGLG